MTPLPGESVTGSARSPSSLGEGLRVLPAVGCSARFCSPAVTGRRRRTGSLQHFCGDCPVGGWLTRRRTNRVSFVSLCCLSAFVVSGALVSLVVEKRWHK